MIRVAIADRQHVLKLDRQRLRGVVRAVLRDEGIEEGEISLAFVDDEEIADLNWRFLRHRGPTDVITFPFHDGEESGFSGEIVASTTTAKNVAERMGHDPADELFLYVIHGLLHLKGYDDHSIRDRKTMRNREAHHLRNLAIALSLNGPV